MFLTRNLKVLAIAAVCALAGAGAGIAGAGAHGNSHFFHHGHGFGKFGRAPVHAELVVPARDNTFKTLTFDRGTVDSVSGDQLTIKEGTRSATYKTISLTIPSDAKVRRNGEDAQLSDLQQGDTVAVLTSNGKTLVKAFSAQAEQQRSGAESHSRRHH
jgi:hypothetical protein